MQLGQAPRIDCRYYKDISDISCSSYKDSGLHLTVNFMEIFANTDT